MLCIVSWSGGYMNWSRKTVLLTNYASVAWYCRLYIYWMHQICGIGNGTWRPYCKTNHKVHSCSPSILLLTSPGICILYSLVVMVFWPASIGFWDVNFLRQCAALFAVKSITWRSMDNHCIKWSSRGSLCMSHPLSFHTLSTVSVSSRPCKPKERIESNHIDHFCNAYNIIE